MFRYLSKKAVEYSRIDWDGNEILKEACECKVETLLATIFNLIVVVILAILFSKEYECLIFFLVNSSLRLFSGGTHAKNHFYCILSYVIVMFSSIALAGFLKNYIVLMYIISAVAVALSCAVNHRLSARQNDLDDEDQKRFHGICMQIMLVYALGIIGVCFIDLLLQPISVNVRYFLYIVCFTLIIQAVSLIIERVKNDNKNAD